jgi:general bacterial porin, GBP family
MKTPFKHRCTLAAAAAASLLAALPPAALAQSVVLAGRIDMGVQQVDDGVNTIKRADSGTYTASRLVFRGTEDLGGGLNALFHLEHGFSADTGATAAKFWNRGSYVGLNSKSWGTLTLGRQYVPIFWPLLFGDEGGPLRLHGYSATQTVQRSNFARVTTAASPVKTAGTLDSIGGGIYSIGITSAFEDNVVIYKTPSLGGLTITGAVGAPEGYPAGGGKIYGGNAEYRSGSLYLGYGFNRKEGRVPVGRGVQKVDEQAITGMYGITKEFSVWGNFHPWQMDSAGTKFKGSDWMLGVSFRTGAHMVWANVADKSLKSGCNRCDSSGYGIGYHYALSKRTDLYAAVAGVRNEANSANSMVGISPAGPGRDMRGLTAGIAHVF